jgi:hypothetical protein
VANQGLVAGLQATRRMERLQVPLQDLSTHVHMPCMVRTPPEVFPTIPGYELWHPAPLQVYSACAGVAIPNSPFAQTPAAGPGSLPIASADPTRLSDLFPTEASFCSAFSASDFCYDGAPYKLPPAGPANATSGMCVEKIGSGTYINMAAIPGAPALALLASQYGRVSGLRERGKLAYCLCFTLQVHWTVFRDLASSKMAACCPVNGSSCVAAST